ncbi:MAG TPA: GH3 auxin-responsive promoter family protein [Verrucomicrobiae bacterium]|nr:GH3 auxin-responsive promoter family protein [Verrucomicrobiae bacterium]
MRLLIKAAAFVTRRQWKRWHKLTSKPQETQDRLLLGIVGRNRATRFGRAHNFKSIGSLSDYRNQVAIADYERLRPYIELVKNGETDALTAERVEMFTMTSGSTGEPKLIPVTATTRENHRQLTRLWYYRALVDHPDLFNGKLLGVVSPAVEGRTPGGIPFGAASGLIYQSTPSWIQNAYAVPYEVSDVRDFEAKYYLIMRLALEQDISFFGTPNPSTILKLVESASRNKDDIIKDIADGTIASRFDLPAELRASLLRRLGKNPTRARRLESLIKHDGALRPKEYWPRLQLIGCWKGGSVGVRLKEFAGWFGKTTPVRDLGYMASEAQMTLPVFDAGSAGILAIDKNFYEFIPESEITAAAPTVLTCSELEEGQLYYVILTTAGGLYRYDINDVVRVAGFYKQTPLIEFVRKGRDVTSITGEKLHVNQVIQAMARAQGAAGVTVQHFRACADAEKSLYAFSVELDGVMPSRENLSQLLQALDAGLQELNVEYAQKRESRRLDAPVLCVMKRGWFERKAHTTLQRGGRDVQFKAQLLCATPEDPDEIQFIVQSPDAAWLKTRD